MELKVIKPFHGKVEDKVMDKGELIHSADVERINALVGGGFAPLFPCQMRLTRMTTTLMMIMHPKMMQTLQKALLYSMALPISLKR